MSDGNTPQNKTGSGSREPSTGEAAEAQVAKANRQAASYRTQRNKHLRRAHAYEVILRAHNIDISAVKRARLSDLPIREGRVDGEYAYEAPDLAGGSTPTEPGNKVAAPAPSGSLALTLEEVQSMTTTQINDRWDEVSELLKSRKR